MRLKAISESKEEDFECENCGKCMKDCENNIHCIRKSGAFMSPIKLSQTIEHSYYLNGNKEYQHMAPTKIEIKPYSFVVRCFDWLMVGNSINLKGEIMENLEKSYKDLVAKIITDIKNTQKTIFAGANKDLLSLYYRIGEHIDKNAVYGNKFVENLSIDIKLSFPNSRGFSVRNLKNMHKYYKICINNPIVQTASAQLPWSHNILIFDKIQDDNIRLWYINETAKAGWSYDTLAMQIKTDVYKRQVINEKSNNYDVALPENTGKIANELMKDPYILNLASLDADFIERELENKMVEQIKTVLIELGTGFSFVGSEYKVTLSDKDYYIDLLFYHTILHSYVAVELKNTEFKPEYIGKMNFYLTALDETVKSDKDGNSIGLILCRDKDRLTVEYALKDVNKPIGVSSYEIQKYLPKELSINLPTADDINLHINIDNN